MSNMVVRTNIFALNAHRNMKNVGLEQGRASNRLSSGFRINSAADDAAGLAISETMRAQIRGLDQASRNTQDGQAMILTTEGGLEEIGNMLQRTRELLVQASNDTNTQGQRNMIEQEINQLSQEIGSMQQRVEFNTNRVLAMGPAMSSAINNAVADIEADSIRVSDAFALIDANSRAVAEAREMLATLPGTQTFESLNSRQQAQVIDALKLVDLDSVTAGRVTDSATTNIPAPIAGVTPGGAAVKSDIHAAALAALDTINALAANAASARGASKGVLSSFPNEMEFGTAAITLVGVSHANLAAAFGIDPNTQNVANLADLGIAADRLRAGIASIGGVAGTTMIGATYNADAVLAQLNIQLVAIEGLIEAIGAVDRNGFATVELVGTAQNAINTALSNYEEYHGHLATALLAHPVGSAAYHDAQSDLATKSVALEAALGTLPPAFRPGSVVAEISTVTFIQGLLNTRDTDLANATTTLNEVRAEMLRAAEVEFQNMSDFARFEDWSSTGDFVAWFQVGANANQGIQFDFETVSRTVSTAAAVVNLAAILVANPETGGGIGRGIEVSPIISQVQNSLDDVNRVRANLGALQNRMDYTMRSLDISSENLSDSESRVRNADVAREMMRFTMANVLQQAAVSMLAQANQLPNNLLQLLR